MLFFSAKILQDLKCQLCDKYIIVGGARKRWQTEKNTWKKNVLFATLCHSFSEYRLTHILAHHNCLLFHNCSQTDTFRFSQTFSVLRRYSTVYNLGFGHKIYNKLIDITHKQATTIEEKSEIYFGYYASYWAPNE